MPRPTTNFRNGYQFTAREWDKETGLYYYRARYYDPMEGRFISKDPIGFESGDVNLYGYVHNNPINQTDPTGLSSAIAIPVPRPKDIPIPGWCSAAALRALSFATLVLTISGDTPVCDDNGEPKGCRDDKNGKWMCEGNVKYDIIGTPKHVIMGPWVVAYGNTAVEASQAWIKACQASAPRGHTARHIQPRCRKLR